MLRSVGRSRGERVSLSRARSRNVPVFSEARARASASTRVDDVDASDARVARDQARPPPARVPAALLRRDRGRRVPPLHDARRRPAAELRRGGERPRDPPRERARRARARPPRARRRRGRARVLPRARRAPPGREAGARELEASGASGMKLRPPPPPSSLSPAGERAARPVRARSARRLRARERGRRGLARRGPARRVLRLHAEARKRENTRSLRARARGTCAFPLFLSSAGR